MHRRKLVSSLFFLGLVVGVVALLGLSALDNYLSRFGDGSGSTSNTAGTFNRVFALLICSYFVVSALGILLARTRVALLAVAGFAHALLLAAYLMIFFACYGGSTFVTGMIIITVVAVIFFSPWLVLWRHVLRKSLP